MATRLIVSIPGSTSSKSTTPSADIWSSTLKKRTDSLILTQSPGHPLQGEPADHSRASFTALSIFMAGARDGLGGLSERHPDLNVEADTIALHPQLRLAREPAAQLSLELLRSYPPRSITYIALGPLTNLATMVRRDHATVSQKIGRVVCMGGALDVPGNTTPVAEFNFYADPYAVKELLAPSPPNQGLPLERFLLLSLDLTTPHELPFQYYKANVDPKFGSCAAPSQAQEKSPIIHFTSAFLERTREVMLEFGKDAMELHDIAAVWCALENPPSVEEISGTRPALSPGWEAVERRFEIERIGEYTRGMLVVDRREDPGVALTPGANRSNAHCKSEEQMAIANKRVIPARVEVESKGGSSVSVTDLLTVSCVSKTPGRDALLALLVKRVWGVLKPPGQP